MILSDAVKRYRKDILENSSVILTMSFSRNAALNP